MNIAELNIQNIRNFSAKTLDFHQKYNFICGDNGSGKTSLLESIYLLGHARSFRTRQASHLISEGAKQLSVFARLSDSKVVSLQKYLDGVTHVKFNQERLNKASDLARIMPCQLFYADIFNIIDAGPSVRREVLDWGLFHVKHSFGINESFSSYHTLLMQYRKVLKHRNALLRQQAPDSMFDIWNQQLVFLAEKLDELRVQYMEQLKEIFTKVLRELTDVTCELDYFRGWDKKNNNVTLENILKQQLLIDRQKFYTTSGAHQADLVFKTTSSSNAKQTFSRGQQKIILIALKLSQAQLLNTSCIYLIDDLAAELDMPHVVRVLDFLNHVKGQIFITTIDQSAAEKWSKIYSSKIIELF